MAIQGYSPQKSGTQSGTVAVTYFVRSPPGAASVTIATVEFRTLSGSSGGTFAVATVSGLPPSVSVQQDWGASFSIDWDTAADGVGSSADYPDLYYELRVTFSDSSQVSTPPILVRNFGGPSATDFYPTDLAYVQLTDQPSIDVTPAYSVTAFAVPVVEWFDGTTWQPATTSVDGQNLTTGVATAFTWFADQDVPNTSATTRLRITLTEPVGQHQGAAVETPEFVIDTRPLEPVIAESLVGATEQSGVVQVDYTLADPRNLIYDVEPQHSFGGVIWQPSTIEPASDAGELVAGSGGSPYVFLWDSAADGVRRRWTHLRAFARKTGTASYIRPANYSVVVQQFAIFALDIEAVGSNQQVDTTLSGPTVTLQLLTGAGTLGGTLSQSLTNGVASFTDLTYSESDSFAIQATVTLSNGLVTTRTLLVTATAAAVVVDYDPLGQPAPFLSIPQVTETTVRRAVVTQRGIGPALGPISDVAVPSFAARYVVSARTAHTFPSYSPTQPALADYDPLGQPANQLLTT